MIEIGEVVPLGRQMNAALAGKRVAECARGKTPHKWVFFNEAFDERAPLASGAAAVDVVGSGKCVYTTLANGLRLMFGEMGGRVTYHAPDEELPAKYHFVLRLDDGSAVTLAVQGWGFVSLLPAGEAPPEWAASGEDPLSPDFTLDRFMGIWRDHPEREKGTMKAFLVSRPRIAGIGNGYAQDILYQARIRPDRKMRDVTDDEAARLHEKLTGTLREAVRLGGRDTERDLYGQPGRYAVSVDKRAAAKPCRRCGGEIAAIKLLGGTSYYCKGCQT
jgi:formamidopyrimidine-DNA glycosylase